jgi:orotidine-5'-phosphate decarboxylase
MMRRFKWTNLLTGEPYPSEPFVMDNRSHDIPNTIAGYLRALPANCVAVSLRHRGGWRMARRAEREARQRNMRILWLP